MYKIKEYKIRGKKHLNYKNLEEALKAMAELEGYGGEKQVYKHKGFDIKINKDGEDFQATLFFVNIEDGLESIRRGHYIVNKDLKSFLEEEREKSTYNCCSLVKNFAKERLKNTRYEIC